MHVGNIEKRSTSMRCVTLVPVIINFMRFSCCSINGIINQLDEIFEKLIHNTRYFK